jgi:hypothetical protein
MIRKTLFALSLLALTTALPAAAAEEMPAMTPEEKAMMEAYQAAGTPGEAHAWLAKAVGSYDLSIRSWAKPGTEPTVEAGTATRTMALDGRVLVEEVHGQTMGQAFTGHGMHGFDNVTGKHWSTWNDSMSTGIMLSEGTCDAQGACTFTGSWNDPMTKAKVNARMTSRWTDANTEVFSMFAPGPDGTEFQMMEITYKKKP